MQSLLIMSIASGTFLATLAGGALALRFRDQLHLILGFSAGAIIGLAFFDLLPEALKIGSGDPSTILSITALGFFGYATLDRLILLHTHHDGGEHTHDASAVKRGWAGAGSLSAHSLIDGLAIGIAFRASSAIGFVVAAAVLAHDCSDGMNTVNLVLRNAGTRRQAFQWLFVDAVAPVVGAALSLFISLPGEALSLVLALFAGFFLYIGASDLLPESFHAHPKALTTITTLLGAATLYIVVRLAG
ncbi:MAG: ZIP family metal transporter [Rhizomicrobium sp.]|jgi:ZIP family zinc transporter